MNRKGKIIVSVVGIFIVLLALVGITYGYFLTRIQGNTNTTSVSVTTADLKLAYKDGNGIITASNIMPNTKFLNENGEGKIFTVTNEGNAKVENYAVVLEDYSVTYTDSGTLKNGTPVDAGEKTVFDRPEDFKYTLSCTSYINYGTDTETVLGECNEETTQITLPMENSILLTNDIEVGVTHVYELIVEYIDPDEDQSSDMNKSLSMKVNIYDIRNFNPYKEGTLADAIFSNSKIIKNNISPKFTGMATKEEGLYPAEDDYGYSWYFRGAQTNNYVSFAGFTWRIVRINGDGSVRLILDGTLDKVTACDDETICTTSAFNSNKDDNAYVGYMYGLVGVTSDNVCVLETNGVKSIATDITDKTSCTGEWISGYDATHMNINNSTIKDKLDSFYVKYLKSSENYLADTMFCGDKSLADTKIGTENTALGYGINQTYYAATERLYFSEQTSNIGEAFPTLKCANDEINNYSRYTVDKYLINGIETNGDLTYPIALLTADELVLAGAWGEGEVEDVLNESYYLYNEENLATRWTTMTPYANYMSSSNLFISYIDDYSLEVGSVNTRTRGVRPVINLNANVLVDAGNGTSGTGVYTVKLPS